MFDEDPKPEEDHNSLFHNSNPEDADFSVFDRPRPTQAPRPRPTQIPSGGGSGGWQSPPEGNTNMNGFQSPPEEGKSAYRPESGIQTKKITDFS